MTTISAGVLASVIIVSYCLGFLAHLVWHWLQYRKR